MATVSPVERRVVRRNQMSLLGCTGVTLHCRSWQPAQPHRQLLLVHDLGEHSGRWDALGAWFAARDFAVYAYDQTGHGQSEGVRGLGSPEAWVADLDRVAERVAEEHPDLPAAVLGSGFGALLVLRWLAQEKPPVRAAGLVGAPLDPGAPLRVLPSWWRRCLGWVRPQWALTLPLDTAVLSRDPTVGRDYREDPGVVSRVPARTLALVRELGARAQSEAVAFPVFVAHGEADPLAPVQAVRRFHARLSGIEHRLRIYPRLRHEILQEPEGETVMQDLLDWFQERGL